MPRRQGRQTIKQPELLTSAVAQGDVKLSAFKLWKFESLKFESLKSLKVCKFRGKFALSRRERYTNGAAEGYAASVF